jgi:hypothetical protein
VLVATPAWAADPVLRCQRAIETGGYRFARAVLRESARCARSDAPSFDACVPTPGSGRRAGAAAREWRERVERACAGVDVHSELGYPATCGPPDASCGFATAALLAPGAENDLLDCLECRVAGRVRSVSTKLFADRPVDGACREAIGVPGHELVSAILGELNACLGEADAISIAGCLSDPDRRARLSGRVLAWRSDAQARCAGADPFGGLGHARLCSGFEQPRPPFCSDASPPCTFAAATRLATSNLTDDDLLDCLECQASEAALGIARDLYGAEVCCDAVACRTVRSRAACRRASGHPVYYRMDVLAGVPAGFPHGIAVASDGTVYVPDRFRDAIWTVPPGMPAELSLVPSSPDGLALDADERLFIAHRQDNRITRFEGEGALTPFALTGDPGHEGDGGLALLARAAAPNGLVFDSRGTLYFTESGLLAFAFQGAPATGEFVRSVDPAGRIRTVAGATGIPLLIPYSMAARSDASILIGEAGSQRILELDPGVRLVHLAGRPSSPIGAHSGDGGPALDARFNGVEGLAVDPGGNTLIGDFRNGRVRLLDRLGSVITVLGREDGLGRWLELPVGVPGTQAWGGCPGGVAIGSDGRVYVADGQFDVVRVLTQVPY